MKKERIGDWAKKSNKHWKLHALGLLLLCLYKQHYTPPRAVLSFPFFSPLSVDTYIYCVSTSIRQWVHRELQICGFYWG